MFIYKVKTIKKKIMKKVMAILAVAAVMTACGSKSTEASAEVVVDSTEVSVDSTMVQPTEIATDSTVVVE
tara:strand:+ start:128 stop:337 length:210 start_codon:yes stop_codon:yes gene_type:complete